MRSLCRTTVAIWGSNPAILYAAICPADNTTVLRGNLVESVRYREKVKSVPPPDGVSSSLVHCVFQHPMTVYHLTYVSLPQITEIQAIIGWGSLEHETSCYICTEYYWAHYAKVVELGYYRRAQCPIERLSPPHWPWVDILRKSAQAAIIAVLASGAV